jgi:hypothetical protein
MPRQWFRRRQILWVRHHRDIYAHIGEQVVRDAADASDGAFARSS